MWGQAWKAEARQSELGWDPNAEQLGSPRFPGAFAALEYQCLGTVDPVLDVGLSFALSLPYHNIS